MLSWSVCVRTDAHGGHAVCERGLGPRRSLCVTSVRLGERALESEQ